MDFRRAYYNANHVYPTLTIPVINVRWGIGELPSANYNAGRRRLLAISDLRADKKAKWYTLHSGKNFYHTCGAQLRMGLEERNKLGHWATQSSTPDRYDRV